MRLRRATQPPTDAVEGKVAALIALTYELLDAHADTARLAADGTSDTEWDSHLAYLRDLQRVGRETVARAALPSGRSPSGR